MISSFWKRFWPRERERSYSSKLIFTMYKIKSKKILIILIIVFALIFLHYTKILRPVENAFLSLTQPVAERLYGLGSLVKTSYNRQVGAWDQAEKIRELEAEVNRLTIDKAEKQVLEEENRALRSYLNFLEEAEYDYILANLLSREIAVNPQERRSNIVIDRGSKAGLEKGLLVVDSQGLVVGKLGEVRPESSEIILITSSDCQIASTLQNQERTSGVVTGELGLTMNMEFIPQDEEIREGDLVVTSGLERNIPRGRVLGRVTEVDSSRDEVWQRAVIEPLVDFDDLSLVSILLP